MPDTATQCVLSAPESGLSVVQGHDGDRLTYTVRVRAGSDCVLHWGLSRRPGGPWLRPPARSWPAGTTPADGPAVRTPFAAEGAGEREVKIEIAPDVPARLLSFVVYLPSENRWINCRGKDFSVELPRPNDRPAPEEALARWAPGDDVRRQTFTLDGGDRLAAAVRETPDAVRVSLACNADGPCSLHWGVAWRFRQEWKLPPEELRPAGTAPADGQAVQTPFAERDGLLWLEWEWPKPADGRLPRGLRFVLHGPDGWLKSGGHDLYLPLIEGQGDPRLPPGLVEELAEQIIAAEMGTGSWTLMHRFNLCHDLLDRAQDDPDALALLFAWLRYSANRQLDWQRNYNTQPRDLSHAQDRLTLRLAGVWQRHAGDTGEGITCRTWARLMLTTLGRGGEGQRVRDGILHIMHRNHLKEVSGHFIEEWHQKLHNNTTPDDVVICAAYLAFLRANGDRGTFYRVLGEGGVTRERLASFERPIRSEPNFYGDRRDALIRDFEEYLGILKSVHAGADLDGAAGPARGRLSREANRKLDEVFGLRHRQAPVRDLAAVVVAVREEVARALTGAGDDAARRDLLFLDLGLGEFLRGVIERQPLSRLGRDELADLVRWALRGAALSAESAELERCTRHWAGLLDRPRDGQDWALHARSVAERAARWVQGYADDLYRCLQPKAEALGEAFGAERWAVSLFSEEVIRGGPTFALSLLLRPLDPILRTAAGLGGWQVISPGRASGRVRLAARLLDVQEEHFAEPTVLIADAVSGNEEVPPGVTAVLTRDTPDLVSHVAVRARNAPVLFATCFDADTYERLKGLADQGVSLCVTPRGDVEVEQGLAPAGNGPACPDKRPAGPRVTPRGFTAWALTEDQLTPEVVGGKSNNLGGLRGRLPDWIHLPTSIALPFGVFLRVLEDNANRDLRGRYLALLADAEGDPAGVLPRVRELLLGLTAPPELRQAVEEAWRRAGLPALPWEQAWPTICRVWASLWNERAFLSRRAAGTPHDALRMAVLVQQVIEADYAYVLHTANPITGDRGEIYGEVVLGLGETLVGNYPGRALSFVCRKDDLQPRLLSYPSKSVGLYGRGVIFRSDSNGEDLEGFAGAGLYDSFLAHEPEHRVLDYAGERLVWDAGFRDDLLRSLARVGVEVERLLGTPQDVEGAVAGGRYHVVQTRPQVGLGILEEPRP